MNRVTIRIPASFGGSGSVHGDPYLVVRQPVGEDIRVHNLRWVVRDRVGTVSSTIRNRVRMTP